MATNACVQFSRGVVDTSLSVTCNIIELNKGLLFIFLSHYFKHIFTTNFFYEKNKINSIHIISK